MNMTTQNTEDMQIVVLRSLAAVPKVKEFRIHEEMLMLDDTPIKYKIMIKVLSDMVSRRMIKQFMVYDDVANADRVIKIEKL